MENGKWKIAEVGRRKSESGVKIKRRRKRKIETG
jgi:hypothetical protein